MRRTSKLLCILLVASMLLSLAACGGGKPADPNLLKVGKYELLYKGACIMKDYDGNDALVLTLDYTNNTDENDCYLLSIVESATQNGTELTLATIFTGEDSFDTICDGQYTDVLPGETLEIKSAFVLTDTTSKVEVKFEELFGSKSASITVDPSTLSQESAGSGASGTKLPGGNGDPLPTQPDGTGDALLDWWNGDWYGWWIMTGCWGYYEDMEGEWWDVCGRIDIGEDYIGEVTLWDEDYTEAEPMASAAVSLNEAGTSELGTVMSEGGWFTDIPLEHADWIVDPGLLDYEDMIHISGFYENGDDEFTYDIYLRPWGTYWDDVAEEDLPYYYYDWYLPMIEAGEAMPDAIGEGAPSGGGSSSGSNTGGATGDIPNGDGIVTDEQVQKGYVYMSEVAKDIFNTTYEELAAYFGVDGKFDKEEYSDVYEANMRFYKWISSENPHNFIYVNFVEEEPGVYEISAYNTSGFSGSEAVAKYLDEVKAEAAEADRAAAANAVMKEITLEVLQFAKDDVKVKITTSIPESGWSTTKDSLVENEDPDAFGAGEILFKVRSAVADFDSSKDSFKNYQEIEDRVIGGITFHGRTYEYIGYDWIEYVAQIDDTRALSIGLIDMDCFEGTMPDIILNNMKFQ